MLQLKFPLSALMRCLLLSTICLLAACSSQRETELASALDAVQIDQQIQEIRIKLAEEELDAHRSRLDGMLTVIEDMRGGRGSAGARGGQPQTSAAGNAASRAGNAQANASNASNASGATTSPERQAYERALATQLGGNPKASEPMFTEFLEKYPNSRLAPNAEYWLGESFYSQRRYSEAILAFQNVLVQHPKHDKAPDSLLKVGYSYERLGDRQNAVFYLQQLLEVYQDSKPAPQARAALKRLQ